MNKVKIAIPITTVTGRQTTIYINAEIDSGFMHENIKRIDTPAVLPKERKKKK